MILVVIFDFIAIAKFAGAGAPISNYFNLWWSMWHRCELRLKARFRAFHRNGFVMRGRIFENVQNFKNIQAGEGFGH